MKKVTEVVAALIRECREELAITISIGSVFMEMDHNYPDLNVHLTLFNAAISERIPPIIRAAQN